MGKRTVLTKIDTPILVYLKGGRTFHIYVDADDSLKVQAFKNGQPACTDVTYGQEYKDRPRYAVANKDGITIT